MEDLVVLHVWRLPKALAPSTVWLTFCCLVADAVIEGGVWRFSKGPRMWEYAVVLLPQLLCLSELEDTVRIKKVYVSLGMGMWVHAFCTLCAVDCWQCKCCRVHVPWPGHTTGYTLVALCAVAPLLSTTMLVPLIPLQSVAHTVSSAAVLSSPLPYELCGVWRWNDPFDL